MNANYTYEPKQCCTISTFTAHSTTLHDGDNADQCMCVANHHKTAQDLTHQADVVQHDFHKLMKPLVHITTAHQAVTHQCHIARHIAILRQFFLCILAVQLQLNKELLALLEILFDVLKMILLLCSLNYDLVTQAQWT